MCIAVNFSWLETIDLTVERKILYEALEVLVANKKAMRNVSLHLPVTSPESYYEVEGEVDGNGVYKLEEHDAEMLLNVLKILQMWGPPYIGTDYFRSIH